LVCLWAAWLGSAWAVMLVDLSALAWVALWVQAWVCLSACPLGPESEMVWVPVLVLG
jgi:hypothetical protein